LDETVKIPKEEEDKGPEKPKYPGHYWKLQNGTK
jgi:hypothetical protein